MPRTRSAKSARSARSARPRGRKKNRATAHSSRGSNPRLRLVPAIRNRASNIAAEFTSGVKNALGNRGGSISNDVLLDFLSEFLAVEQGGTKLYAVARDRSSNRELRDTYKKYLRQTKRHAELLVGAIHKLGGNPDFVSPGAEIQKQRAQFMLNLEVVPELREIQDAENLLLAETKDHADWEFLDKISSQVEDPKTQKILRDIVSEVEDQEDEHLDFARKAVDQLVMKFARSEMKKSGKAA